MPAPGATANPEGPPLHGKKLVSWKEIATHLGREVRTVQRWEKSEGLPVHRHEHQKRSTVYAYAGEIDEWFKKRQPADDPEADAAFEPEPDIAEPSLGSDNDKANSATPPTSAADPTASQNREPHPNLKRKRLTMALAVAALLLAAYGASHWIQAGVLAHKKVRLIVMPFTNLSGDPRQDYLSAGMTDEMITRLGSLDPSHLGVIAATSSNVLAGKPISQIGRALDVQYAMEGTVRRDANRVRIDVQLIQVSDETHLWANSYDRDLDDILRVQDEVASAVAGQIRLTLDPSRTKPGGGDGKLTVNPEAYDAYLRGRFYWTNRGDLHKGIDAYQEAIEKDPRYALAHAGLASSYALLGQQPYDDLAPSDAK